jgi:hypothetical protein
MVVCTLLKFEAYTLLDRKNSVALDSPNRNGLTSQGARP